MRKALLWLIVLAALAWGLTRPVTLEPDRLPNRDADLANGERVFHAGGCASCHGEDLAGGQVFETAFGTFRAPNISPDPEFGIGGWSDLDLANAMMRGVSPGGEHYFLVDPLGNLMMHYDLSVPARGLMKDLQKLLKVSQIG